MIKAVILDMDGLLIDSEPFWQDAHVAGFSSVGVPITPDQTKNTVGLRVDEGVEYWFARYPWKGKTKKEVEAAIVRQVIALIKKEGIPRPGAREVIELLAHHYPLAIASSSPMDVIEAVMEVLHVRKYLKAIYSAEHEPYGKPHPGVFITAAKKLEVAPEFCLVFEDTPNGVIAAKAARMTVVAVPYEGLVDDPRFCIADLRLMKLTDFRLDQLREL